jgi:FSR family fosmidomycin resistance protein-like MFS transporter
MSSLTARRSRTAVAFVLTLLAVELLDEFVFGAREAAWPLVRDSLGLTYAQIGLLLGVPELVATFIEPAIGVLGDTWNRRVLVLGGGVCFALSCALVALSHSFLPLMVAFVVFYPSSGAFVNLSQAALMDHQPTRHEQNMARWTLAGSLGVVLGSLSLGAFVQVGLGWEALYWFLAVATLVVVVAAWQFRFPTPNAESEERISFVQGMKNALAALRRRDLLRWLVLLEFSDLMLDILLGYLALYCVDVAHVSEAEAGLAVAVWTGIGLLGDVLLIPLLERVRGLDYLRVSAVIELVLFVSFLLVPSFGVKLVLLGLLGFFNSGWYSILQGQVYSAMPGQSGTVMTVHNFFGVVGGLLPLSIGLAAEHFGLGAAMWLLLLGPLALLVGLPRRGRDEGRGMRDEG